MACGGLQVKTEQIEPEGGFAVVDACFAGGSHRDFIRARIERTVCDAVGGVAIGLDDVAQILDMAVEVVVADAFHGGQFRAVSLPDGDFGGVAFHVAMEDFIDDGRRLEEFSGHERVADDMAVDRCADAACFEDGFQAFDALLLRFDLLVIGGEFFLELLLVPFDQIFKRLEVSTPSITELS